MNYVKVSLTGHATAYGDIQFIATCMISKTAPCSTCAKFVVYNKLMQIITGSLMGPLMGPFIFNIF